MRFSTIISSLLALGVVSAAAAVDAPNEAAAGLSARDAAPVMQSRDFERKLSLKNRRGGHRQSSLITNGMMTWYGGGQLDAPACGGSKPSKWDHIIAVKEGGSFRCGDEVHIHHNGKMVKAHVRDYCGGCLDNHIDATQGLFQEFAGLDVGELHGLHIRIIPKN